jgi:Flp pilus assembly protein TadD
MGRWHRKAWQLACLGALVAQVGCMTTGKTDSPSELGLSPSMTAEAPTTQAQPDELPKKQALQASLAVAQNLDRAKNDDGAIEQYEKVLKLEPQNLIAWRRLAVLYDRKNEFSKSDAFYKKAAAAQPRDADLLNDWGYSYYLRNNWTEAESKLRKALEIDKKHARAHSNLGLVLGQQGKYADALKMFREAEISEAEAHCNLAFVYLTQGKLEEAKAECTQARKADPSCSKAQEMLAKLDRPPEAAGGAVAKPKNAAQGLAPDEKRAKALALAAEARAKLGATEAGPAGPPVADAPGSLLAEAPGKPVYRSPSGISWVPVPKSSSAPPPPAAPEDQGVPGTATFDP